MHKLITITTDFGDSFAVSQLHAVLASCGFNGKIIENHNVTAFSIIEGAFQIKTLSKYCSKNAIHVGIVDPGVGSGRDGVIIKTGKSFFVGPNNGLLYPALTDDIIEKVWKIDEAYFGKNISRTFHGRDIFIKAAALLAKGKGPESFGSNIYDKNLLIKLSFEKGQILHIDSYGNLKINWQKNIVPGKILHINGNKVPIVKTFSDVSSGKLMAYLGSSNTLELAVNQGNANGIFNLKVGDKIKIL